MRGAHHQHIHVHEYLCFFFNDTATTEIYTLSLHDALPISMKNINHTRSSISDDIRNILCSSANMRRAIPLILQRIFLMSSLDRKSGSAGMPRPISYAVFCLKKKKRIDPEVGYHKSQATQIG